jgi:hypothetical protein
MNIIRALFAFTPLIFVLSACATSSAGAGSDDVDISDLDLDVGLGLPNGSSEGEEYLTWLVPTDDHNYGYSQDQPVMIGGFLEGAGNRWSSQYFSSLLGPNGEPTRFERVSSCCGFRLSDPKFVAEGMDVGYLDEYRVAVDGADPVTIYVSLYAEAKVYAPKGFRTRGESPQPSDR